MGRSIESSRPIMAPSVSLNMPPPLVMPYDPTNKNWIVTSKRTSKRFSTFSGVPSFAASDATITTNASSTSNDPRLQEIKEWTQGFDRLENKRLQQQRYQPTPEKSDNLSKLALGAKVERALGRRMTDQDASMKVRPKLLDEKAGMGRSVTIAP